MRIAVLGVGLVGGSIGLAAKRRVGATVAGFDPDRGTADLALEVGAIDDAPGSVEGACEGADVVFCAAPVGALPELVEAALAASGPETVVSDVGSTKLALAERLSGEERFVGGHPLAGAETSGVANARGDLFEGARWYLTPTPQTAGQALDRLHRLVSDIGARPQAIDAETHDRVMATVSHLPHVIANVLVNQAAAALAEEHERLPEVGPSFRDTTRVAGANPRIWSDIFLANGEAVASEIDAVVDRLQASAKLLRSGEAEPLRAWIESAREDRRRLLEAELAGGPVRELRVGVPNKPGVVAEIALALGRAGVNIVDMALYPAADLQAGAISLWIAGDEEASRAAELVGGLGHAVSVIDGS